MSSESEAARALSVHATLVRAKEVSGAGLPANVVMWLLHPDHVLRTEILSKMASAVERAIEAEGSVRERVEGLLHIDPVSWSGGSLTAVPIEQLMDKAQRAAQARRP